MAFCSKCGKPIGDEDAFCRSCGAQVLVLESEISSVVETTQKPDKKKLGKKAKIGIGIGITAVVVAIGILAAIKFLPKKVKVNDTINPAFYSEETLVKWCEENDYTNWNDIDIGGLVEFHDEKKTLLTRDMFEEWLSDSIGDVSMVCAYGSYTKGDRFGAHIQDVPSMCSLGMPDMWIRIMDWYNYEARGIYVDIEIYNNYELSDKYDSIEERLKDHGWGDGSVGIHKDNDYDDVIEISDLTYARYCTGDAAYPSNPRSYYSVELSTFDSKTGNVVIVRYFMPVEDNEDEIQELRDLGIPVITDFIK